MTLKRLYVVAGLAVLIGLSGTSLSAASTEAKPAKTEPAQASTTADAAMPFTLEGTDLGRMLNRDISTLLIRKTRQGSSIRIDGGFRSVLVIQTDADGKAVVSCIATEKEAAAVFAAPRKKTVEEH